MSKYGLFVKDDPVYKTLITNGVRMFNLKVTNEQKLTPYMCMVLLKKPYLNMTCLTVEGSDENIKAMNDWLDNHS